MYDRAVEDLTDEQAHYIPEHHHQSIAFCLWHYVRTEDNIVRFVLQRRPTVWIEGGWPERFGLDARAQGTGMSDEDARSLRISPLADFRTYMQQVWAATDEYLGQASPAELERVVTIRPLGELSVFNAIASVCLSHGLRHLGEIEFARGFFGLKGAQGF